MANGARTGLPIRPGFGGRQWSWTRLPNPASYLRQRGDEMPGAQGGCGRILSRACQLWGVLIRPKSTCEGRGVLGKGDERRCSQGRIRLDGLRAYEYFEGIPVVPRHDRNITCLQSKSRRKRSRFEANHFEPRSKFPIIHLRSTGRNFAECGAFLSAEFPNWQDRRRARIRPARRRE